MREVMFRGKRLHNGAWVYGFYVHFKYLDGREEHAICAGDARSSVYNVYNFWREVCQETVGQYTGLKDKNGKKIFENDILKIAQTKNGSFYFGIVKFGTYIDDFDINDIKEHIGFYIEEKYGITGILSPKHDEWDSYKVIGNIFDNPELLDVKK